MENKKFALCRDHLTQLYEAIQKDDIPKLLHIEHELTHEEECVACGYALKAHGDIRRMLDTYLQKEGFEVEPPQQLSLSSELEFWFIRTAILVVLFLFYFNFGSAFKTFILDSKSLVPLSSFGLAGIFLLTLASFIFVEFWVIE